MLKKNTLKICIIGMPGSGKSTIGKALSKKLNYDFYDTDNTIEDISRLKISEIFASNGESYFRDLESKVLNQLIKINKVIISTGGGIILKNKKILNKSFNIFLQCDLDVLIERVSRNNNRPLLLNDLKKNMKNLFNQRKELYNKYSDLKINTSCKVYKSVDEILERLPK